jgi:hypothetical protein
MGKTSTLILILFLSFNGFLQKIAWGMENFDSHPEYFVSDSTQKNSIAQNVLTGLISEVKLYPNPVKTQLKVSFYSKETKAGILRVRDLLGKVVKERKTELVQGSNDLEFAVDQLNPGVYFFEINIQGEKKIVKRFIKKD